MRVTENTNYGIVRETIQRSKGRMETLQGQHATLKKLNTPSDNPVGAAKVLEVRTDRVNNDQFMTNAKLAEAYLQNSEHALSEVADILVRAKEIAINQSSGASSNDDTRLGVAEEVTQLYQQAVAAANRKIGDRYLFGGYKTQTAPFDPEGRYRGDQGQMMTEIAKDVFISMNVPGSEAFNTQPNAVKHVNPDQFSQEGRRGPASAYTQPPLENINVFDELQNLRISLLTGDLDGIRSTLERFDQMHGRVTAIRAKIGSRIQGIQNIGTSIERQNLTNAQLTQNLEDADLAKVVSDIAREEAVFRSSLQSSQKLVQPTLMDFLK
jgi:flagellar hook-associated protein 3 FlgL